MLYARQSSSQLIVHEKIPSDIDRDESRKDKKNIQCQRSDPEEMVDENGIGGDDTKDHNDADDNIQFISFGDVYQIIELSFFRKPMHLYWFYKGPCSEEHKQAWPDGQPI
jgi:hypothetical protein